jgi:hypothetical protein
VSTPSASPTTSTTTTIGFPPASMTACTMMVMKFDSLLTVSLDPPQSPSDATRLWQKGGGHHLCLDPCTFCIILRYELMAGWNTRTNPGRSDSAIRMPSYSVLVSVRALHVQNQAAGMLSSDVSRTSSLRVTFS